MTYAKLKEMFPHAPESFLQRNCDEVKTRPQVSHAEQCQRTQVVVSNSEGKTCGTTCAHVCFTLRRVHLLDVDAKFASVKDLLDGIANAGLIHGDKEGQITLEVKQEKVAHYEEETTIIEIDLP